MNKQQRIDRARKACREKWNRYHTIQIHFTEWWNTLEYVPLNEIPAQNHDETGFDYYKRATGESLDEWYDRTFKKPKCFGTEGTETTRCEPEECEHYYPCKEVLRKKIEGGK